MPNPFALPEGMALFTFHGRVVRGKRLGSRLGFPTANIAYDPQSLSFVQLHIQMVDQVVDLSVIVLKTHAVILELYLC